MAADNPPDGGEKKEQGELKPLPKPAGGTATENPRVTKLARHHLVGHK